MSYLGNIYCGSNILFVLSVHKCDYCVYLWKRLFSASVLNTLVWTLSLSPPVLSQWC